MTPSRSGLNLIELLVFFALTGVCTLVSICIAAGAQWLFRFSSPWLIPINTCLLLVALIVTLRIVERKSLDRGRDALIFEYSGIATMSDDDLRARRFGTADAERLRLEELTRRGLTSGADATDPTS